MQNNLKEAAEGGRKGKLTSRIGYVKEENETSDTALLAMPTGYKYTVHRSNEP